MKQRIAIIGGGAAGFFAGINAAETNPDAHIKIFEASKQPLAKVLISGGGRCNVTNYSIETKKLVDNYPRGSKELRGPLTKFGLSETIEWFESRNVPLKFESDLRMFPTSDKSETIANCLLQTAQSLGIVFIPDSRILNISRNQEKKFVLSIKGNRSEEFDILILTTGGNKNSFELAKKLGHSIIDPVPSLFTFEIKDQLIDDLAGISFPLVSLSLSVGQKTFKQTGPLLITHWGLSGPAIIKLSAWAARELFLSHYQAKLKISFLPEENIETVYLQLLQQKCEFPNQALSNFTISGIPRNFWNRILQTLSPLDTFYWSKASNKQLRTLAEKLTATTLDVIGKGVFKEEFVTSGGVCLKEVDFKTMQSKVCPGLFFAGEILDIDGVTGGFNFQSAWTTGWLAGKHCLS